jgi:DNA-directed RNA polymerase specialized sigma24 family protein
VGDVHHENPIRVDPARGWGVWPMDETMDALADSPVTQPSTSDPQRLIASPEVRRLVEGVVRRRVPEREVDDVVQTVLCDALASDRAPDDEEQLRKWIVGITRHKVADFHRKGGRAKHVELPEDAVEGEEPPLSAREWVEWAEKQTEGNPEAQRTLDWMAREGIGEKLAHIAEEEALPATQVRQRVSRLRRFMKQRWAAELAAVAAVVLLALVAWRLLRQEDPIAIPTPVPEVTDGPRVAEAKELRRAAYEQCAAENWQGCLDGLDSARELDAAGDAADSVQEARKQALEALEDQTNNDIAPQKKGPDDSDGKGRKDDLKLGPKPTPKLAPPSKLEPSAPAPINSAPPTTNQKTQPKKTAPAPKKAQTKEDLFQQKQSSKPSPSQPAQPPIQTKGGKGMKKSKK